MTKALLLYAMPDAALTRLLNMPSVKQPTAASSSLLDFTPRRRMHDRRSPKATGFVPNGCVNSDETSTQLVSSNSASVCCRFQLELKTSYLSCRSNPAGEGEPGPMVSLHHTHGGEVY
jgi:hypothetical protein